MLLAAKLRIKRGHARATTRLAVSTPSLSMAAVLDRRARSVAGHRDLHLGIPASSVVVPETDHTLDQPNASEPRCDAPSLGLAACLPRTCQITRQSSSIFIYNTVNLIGLPVACGFRHVKTDV